MPTSTPVTTVIPTFNDCATVLDAIRSVLGQTAPPAEIILVDDASSDGTPNLVAENFGDRVRLVRIDHGGPSRARNAGLDAAQEPYVAFLDADDVWHPEKLAMQMSILQRDSSVGLVACDWVRHSEQWTDALPKTVSESVVSYRDMLILNRFQTSTVVARTELVRSVGNFDPDVDGAEDWDLWVRLAARAPVIKVNSPLVVYRDMPSGYSKDVWRVYQTMQSMLEKHRGQAPLSPASFKEIEAWHHLRFAVAFYLEHDRRRAQYALGRALQGNLLPYVVPAALQYLVPFLYQRMRRRRFG